MVNCELSIKLQIAGLGIIFYSPKTAENIPEGENYLMEHYNEPEDVVSHIYQGTIVGFCTRAPGGYILNMKRSAPHNDDIMAADFGLKLFINVVDNAIVYRDLYDLLRWEKEYPLEQRYELENGYYEVNVLSWLPESNHIGDNQVIDLYFIATNDVVPLKYDGVPTFIKRNQ